MTQPFIEVRLWESLTPRRGSTFQDDYDHWQNEQVLSTGVKHLLDVESIFTPLEEFNPHWNSRRIFCIELCKAPKHSMNCLSDVTIRPIPPSGPRTDLCSQSCTPWLKAYISSSKAASFSRLHDKELPSLGTQVVDMPVQIFVQLGQAGQWGGLWLKVGHLLEKVTAQIPGSSGPLQTSHR